MIYGIDEPIVIWAYGKYVDVINEAISIYQRDINSDVQFEVVELSEYEIYERFESELIENHPNIVLIRDLYLKKYLNYFPNEFLRLDENMDLSLFKDYKIPYIKDKFGKVYSCPLSSGTVALYYRKDIFDLNGIEVYNDIDWETFIDCVKNIQYEGNQYLLPSVDYFAHFLMQSTGHLYYDETNALSSGNVAAVLNLIKELSDNQLVIDEQLSYDIMLERIINGEIISFIGTPEAFSMIKNNVEDQVWGVINLPKNDVLKYDVNSGDHSFLIVDKENEEDDQSYIFEFLSRIFNTDDDTSKEFFGTIAENYDIVPAVNYASDQLQNLTNDGCFNEQEVIKFLDSIDYSIPDIYYGIYTFEINNFLKEYSVDLVNESYTINQIQSMLSAQIEDYSGSDPALVLDHIEIDTEPIKKNYYRNEYFDSTGMIIKIVFTSGEFIFEEPSTTVLLHYGDTQVAIAYAYNGIESVAYQLVEVQDRTIQSITAVPKKRIYYHKTTLTVSDFSVYAIYDVGENYLVDDYEIISPYISGCEDRDVLIRYVDNLITVTNTTSISVRKRLESLEITKSPNKITYYQGEKIRLNGVTGRVYYTNGDSLEKDFTSFFCWPLYAHFNSGSLSTSISISYSEDGFKEEQNVTIYKKIGFELEDLEINQEFENSGKGIINLSTGLYRYYYEDFSNNNPTISISLSRCYTKTSSNDFNVGQGWRLNYQQEIKYINNKWVYFTYDGKKYDFESGYSLDNNRSSIRNEKLGLDLFIDDITNNIILVDRNNNSMVFKNIAGIYRLKNIHTYPSKVDNPRNSYMLEIVYTEEGRIANIYAGAEINEERPYLSFTYENGLLKSVFYLDTKVCTYSYTNGKLFSITKCNDNIDQNYLEITSFNYDGNRFSIFNQTKKDELNNYNELRYLINENTEKVQEFSFGYGDNERKITSISYYNSTDDTITSTDPHGSIILSYKNTVNIISYNEYQVISNYSYKIDSTASSIHLKPKMILSANSNGINPISILDNYADVLTLASDNFEDGVDSWENATIETDACIIGTKCIRYCGFGPELSKRYSFEGLITPRSCFLSIWILGVSKIELNIINNETFNFTFIPNRSISNYWQYYSFPLGLISSSSIVEVKLYGHNSHVDDVKIIKSPYEKLDNYPSVEYDDFGKIVKANEYDPIDDVIISSEYLYDDNHKCINVKKSKQNKYIRQISYTYSNGLLTSVKDYISKQKYVEESINYTNDTSFIVSSTNNIKANHDYSNNTYTSTTQGENGSPSVIRLQKYYDNSILIENVSENNLKNKYIYNQYGLISKANSGYLNNNYRTTLDFTYDTFGNICNVSIGESNLITINYDKNKKLSTAYGNGTTINYTYDDEDRITSVTNNNNNLFNISYNDDTKSSIQISHNDGIVYLASKVWNDGIVSQYEAFTNEYDTKLKVIKYASNAYNNISKVDYIIQNTNELFERVKVVKNSDGFISTITRDSHGPSLTEYSYDNLNRLLQKDVIYDYTPQNTSFKKNYEYKMINSSRSSNLIYKETFNINGLNKSVYQYGYYVNGNIKIFYKNGVVQSEYSYDEHNRLINEINYVIKKKYTYEYDSGGNIIEKRIYNIIDGIISSSYSSNTYNYDTISENCGQNQNWKDQLKKYNNIPISYDTCGNPIVYLGNTLSWSGRYLTQINSINLSYDYSGLRIKKGNRLYYWNNGNIILECFKDNDIEKYIYYYYDDSGICGMYYNDQEYYFEKNIFGDVLAIYDNSGNLKCTYIYDAYGNHLIYDENGYEVTNENFIGNINPFRYRGYYYDKEFGLYYLQSRYYDPNLGRFISPDSIEYLDLESINGLNLYCYCYNDPVMYVDRSGHFAVSTLIILGLIAVGAVVGGTVAGVNSYNNGNTGWELVGDVLGGALIGGAIGGIVGYFAAPGIAAMLSSTGTIGGALAFAGGMGSTGAGIAISSVGQLALAGAVTSVGVMSGITVMAAQTRKSGGYYGERWPGDPHKPDHVHLRGNGIDIRIGRDGKPLPGEDKLGSQARKALERLWDEFVKLFNRW